MITVDVVLLGPPAAGKGTAAEWLREDLGFSSLCTGDVYRDITSHGGTLAEIVQWYLNAGLLLPSGLTNQLTLQFAAHYLREGLVPLMLDGYPRSMDQFEFLVEHYDPKLFLVMDASYEATRLAAEGRRKCEVCGKGYNVLIANPTTCDCEIPKPIVRDDDSEDLYAERYRQYQLHTEPVVHHVLDSCDNVLKFNTLETSADRSLVVAKVRSHLASINRQRECYPA